MNSFTHLMKIIELELNFPLDSHMKAYFILRQSVKNKHPEKEFLILLWLCLYFYKNLSKPKFIKYFLKAKNLYLTDSNNYTKHSEVFLLVQSEFDREIKNLNAFNDCERYFKNEQKDSLELKALDLISQNKYSTDELAEKLYKTDIDFFSAKNRLKNLISRLRQKYPGKIIFQSNIYILIRN